jgi:carboxymethylenebutenolidase
MGETTRLAASDGHELDAYVEQPSARSRGGVVVVQEIFGVTAHIRRVVHELAGLGFSAIAPAMFDRVERAVELPYTEIERGRGYVQKLAWPNTLADVAAAAAAVRGNGRVAIVGFCWGGTVVHVAASELDLAAAVSYYGAAIVKNLDKRPRCPIMYQFGERDASIPLVDIEKIKQANGDGVFHVYPGAAHGFNCEDRPSFDASAARLAFARSVEFIGERLG